MDTILNRPSYDELKAIYSKYFSLGNIATDINYKFGLLSLIGFLTKQARKKNPDVSCYQVIKKITKDNNILSEDYIIGLAIVCEDFMYNVETFNTCGCKSSKEMVSQINNVLEKWLPF